MIKDVKGIQFQVDFSSLIFKIVQDRQDREITLEAEETARSMFGRSSKL